MRTPNLPAVGVSRVKLARHGALHLPRVRGVRVTVRSGHAWLTIDGELRDVVLAAGESLSIDRAADVLITSLGTDPLELDLRRLPVASRRWLDIVRAAIRRGAPHARSRIALAGQ